MNARVESTVVYCFLQTVIHYRVRPVCIRLVQVGHSPKRPARVTGSAKKSGAQFTTFGYDLDGLECVKLIRVVLSKHASHSFVRGE